LKPGPLNIAAKPR